MQYVESDAVANTEKSEVIDEYISQNIHNSVDALTLFCSSLDVLIMETLNELKLDIDMFWSEMKLERTVLKNNGEVLKNLPRLIPVLRRGNYKEHHKLPSITWGKIAWYEKSTRKMQTTHLSANTVNRSTGAKSDYSETLLTNNCKTTLETTRVFALEQKLKPYRAAINKAHGARIQVINFYSKHIINPGE